MRSAFPVLRTAILAIWVWILATPASLGAAGDRSVSGVVVSIADEPVPGVRIIARSASGEWTAESGADGTFRLETPRERLVLRFEGDRFIARERTVEATESIEGLRIELESLVRPLYERVVIVASAVDPGIERRGGAIYRDSLFSRDDQLLHTLDAGINAGQHEGGGKSLEIRRFGFNLDHGGVSGGLKVLVDGVQQNQPTQGHGQGYLGQLKSLTPELVDEVEILDGPFSAEYGDFSGLGVVHIRLKESLPDAVTARLQAGSFGNTRAFVALSPRSEGSDSFLAYERSRTDGPFLLPLGYTRDNLTGGFARRLSGRDSLGLKLNAARNAYSSSGQLPLDEVASGRLDRFGHLDRDGGGSSRSGVLGVYFRRERSNGGSMKVDAFAARSLFDLYSNFTFFLNDPVRGDAFQQHDSRLQEGANFQLLQPMKVFGGRALLSAGANFHDNQILVGLYPTIGRAPVGIDDLAHARVLNSAGYLQQGIDFFSGRLHVEAGLRYDCFRFSVEDRAAADPAQAGLSGRFQPKAGLAVRPLRGAPLTLHFNYGRGISSQDARGVVRNPAGVPISTTDFYQAGASYHASRLSFSGALFLIDRSHEQVYVPDDGSLEFRGPSRAYGYEIKCSIQLHARLSFHGGFTRVTNAFYRGTSPRIYVDSAPHSTANAGLTLGDWRGWRGSLRWRYINSYRLDGENAAIRASGHNVADLSLVRRIGAAVDFHISIDNLTNRRYYETQNYFVSRLRPADPAIARIHGTPGYPRGVSAGLTFHLASR